MRLYPSQERGTADHGWLKSHHSFSFASYYNPEFIQFRSLRVINEDWIAPETGFGTHPHADMEIITYVVSGAVTHADTLGSQEVVRAGEIQMMSAGTGVRHSEHNRAASEPLHLLQIWLFPKAQGLEPRYQQKAYSPIELERSWIHLVSDRDGAGLVQINQDANLYATKAQAGDQRELGLGSDRYGWVQLIEGEVEIGGQILKAGDALFGHASEFAPTMKVLEPTHALLFELA
jgi:quercetin 2,3-dioxygenase